MSSIFGGSHEQHSSGNLSYPYLQQKLGTAINAGASSDNTMADLLGLNGGPAQNQGFTNWQNSTGYQFGKQQGMNSITGNAATNGLLNSGATLKALDTFGTNYANTQFGNYFNQLLGLGNQGLQGAGILSGAGQVSSGSQSSNNGGIGKAIGSLLTK